MCHTRLSEDGSFIFPKLSFSDYILYLEPSSKTFSLNPATKTVVVPHAPFFVDWKVTITDFSLSGRVVNPISEGISEVTILLDGSPVTKTDASG